MSWDNVGKDIERGPLGTFKWFAIAVVVLFLFFGVLNAVGLIGGKVVERQVLKNSFQYKEGMEQRAAILESNIAEIDIRLQQNPENADDLRSQRMILSAQLRAITINE